MARGLLADILMLYGGNKVMGWMDISVGEPLVGTYLCIEGKVIVMQVQGFDEKSFG